MLVSFQIVVSKKSTHKPHDFKGSKSSFAFLLNPSSTKERIENTCYFSTLLSLAITNDDTR